MELGYLLMTLFPAFWAVRKKWFLYRCVVFLRWYISRQNWALGSWELGHMKWFSVDRYWQGCRRVFTPFVRAILPWRVGPLPKSYECRRPASGHSTSVGSPLPGFMWQLLKTTPPPPPTIHPAPAPFPSLPSQDCEDPAGPLNSGSKPSCS